MTAVLYRDDYTKERIETIKKKQIGEVYIIPYRARVWCSTSQISVPSCTTYDIIRSSGFSLSFITRVLHSTRQVPFTSCLFVLHIHIRLPNLTGSALCF